MSISRTCWLSAFTGVIAILFLLGSAPTSFAADATAQGVGEVIYRGAAPDLVAKQQAIENAKRDAFNRFTAAFPPARFKLYQSVQSQIDATLDQYLIGVVVLDESVDKGDSKYRVTIRATINEAQLDSTLSSTTGGGQPAKKVALSFLFVAREVASVKQFDARNTQVRDVQDASTAKSDTKAQEKGNLGATANYSESANTQGSAQRTIIVTTGGSSTTQADQTTYTVTSPDDMNATMLDIFSNNGFDVYDYKDVAVQCSGIDPKLIYASFADADELSGTIRKAAFDAAKKCQISTFATGTLDIGLQDTDPVTGNQRIFVSVRAQVFDLSGLLPRVLASVGPIQYQGLGPDQKVAKLNALKRAAQEGATAISDQLKSKGVN